MATWLIGSPRSANITRSPGRRDLQSRDRPTPTFACWRDVRGSFTALRAKTYCTKPEQSNPVTGDVPPYRYGVPRYRSAVGMTRAAETGGATAPPASLTPLRITRTGSADCARRGRGGDTLGEDR